MVDVKRDVPPIEDVVGEDWKNRDKRENEHVPYSEGHRSFLT